jgi:hypothetical protein
MAALLSDLTGDGYVFRTRFAPAPDLIDARCLSMEAGGMKVSGARGNAAFIQGARIGKRYCRWGGF